MCRSQPDLGACVFVARAVAIFVFAFRLDTKLATMLCWVDSGKKAVGGDRPAPPLHPMPSPAAVRARLLVCSLGMALRPRSQAVPFSAFKTDCCGRWRTPAHRSRLIIGSVHLRLRLLAKERCFTTLCLSSFGISSSCLLKKCVYSILLIIVFSSRSVSEFSPMP
jgi:hypothetical protein